MPLVTVRGSVRGRHSARKRARGRSDGRSESPAGLIRFGWRATHVLEGWCDAPEVEACGGYWFLLKSSGSNSLPARVEMARHTARLMLLLMARTDPSIIETLTAPGM
jgi:hypothetical protein